MKMNHFAVLLVIAVAIFAFFSFNKSQGSEKESTNTSSPGRFMLFQGVFDTAVINDQDTKKTSFMTSDKKLFKLDTATGDTWICKEVSHFKENGKLDYRIGLDKISNIFRQEPQEQ